MVVVEEQSSSSGSSCSFARAHLDVVEEGLHEGRRAGGGVGAAAVMSDGAAAQLHVASRDRRARTDAAELPNLWVEKKGGVKSTAAMAAEWRWYTRERKKGARENSESAREAKRRGPTRRETARALRGRRGFL